MNKTRILVAALSLSAAGFISTLNYEGMTTQAVIPVKGDVPTIAGGATRYEDGTKVRMGDTVTPKRAVVLTYNLLNEGAEALKRSIPGVELTQGEFDIYADFIHNYGIGKFNSSSMKRDLLDGNYIQACKDLLKYKYAQDRDCSLSVNTKICGGVWVRSQERYQKCMGEQS